MAERNGNELLDHFDRIISESRDEFETQLEKYGPSFLALRPVSLTDKLLIKAQRVRELGRDQKDKQIPEGRSLESLALINYAIMGLIQLRYSEDFCSEFKIGEYDTSYLLEGYDSVAEDARKIMKEKTHDYGRIWRDMDIRALIDFILEKVYRLKSMLTAEKEAKPEDIADEFVDILNYTVIYSLKLKKESGQRN